MTRNYDVEERVYCVFQGLIIGLFSSAIFFFIFQPLGAPWSWLISPVAAGLLAAGSIEKWPVAKKKGNRRYFYTSFVAGMSATITAVMVLLM